MKNSHSNRTLQYYFTWQLFKLFLMVIGQNSLTAKQNLRSQLFLNSGEWNAGYHMVGHKTVPHKNEIGIQISLLLFTVDAVQRDFECIRIQWRKEKVLFSNLPKSFRLLCSSPHQECQPIRESNHGTPGPTLDQSRKNR